MASSTSAALNTSARPDTSDLLNELYHGFSEGLQGSNGLPAVPFTLASILGEEGIGLLKRRLEDTFAADIQMDVDAIANTVTAMPIGPLSSSRSSSASKSKASVQKAARKETAKVPRPPNAFIIYRKEWHAAIVAENPTLHNNDISIIIGKKWKAESQKIRDEYQQKAENAKQQHLVQHPDYQYQPRKPSERKKRMTKNKLAKLSGSTSNSKDSTTAASQLPLPSFGTLEKVPITEYTLPYEPMAPILHLGKQSGSITFDAAEDTEQQLRRQLLAVLQHPNAQSLPNIPMLPATDSAEVVTNGWPTDKVPHFDITVEHQRPDPIDMASLGLEKGDIQYNGEFQYHGTSTVRGPCFRGHGNVISNTEATYASAEVDRQDRIAHEMSGMFDFDAFVNDFEGDAVVDNLTLELDDPNGTINPADLALGFEMTDDAGAAIDGDFDI